jgi:hypothetical protein
MFVGACVHVRVFAIEKACACVRVVGWVRACDVYACPSFAFFVYLCIGNTTQFYHACKHSHPRNRN